MLTVTNVTKRYGTHLANDRVSLSVKPGRIFGLLGPNGAGKTTLIRMITNIILPDEGEIELDNRPLSSLAQESIGYLPEERGLYKKLTVGQQLTYFGRLKGLTASVASRRTTEWLERLDASGWESKKIQELSKGMQQKIQFISTILHDPSLIILDEPFSGLDPINSQLLIDTVRSLKNEGRTIILSTHQMDQVDKLCDDIALINRGRVVLNGSVRDVKSGHRNDKVVVEFHGDENALGSTEGAEVLSRTAGRIEYRLSATGINADDLLRSLIGRVSITKFEVPEPSLNDIFISTVHHHSVDPTTNNP
jgi:ABC-2 type transport system ATP-binding protein